MFVVAIDWGPVDHGGFVGGNLDLVNRLPGGAPAAESVAYVLVGLGGRYELFFGYQRYAARREPPREGRVARPRSVPTHLGGL